MELINKLRSYVYLIMSCQRIMNIKFRTSIHIRTQSHKLFLNYYESVDTELGNWVFSSVRTPYLSITSFESLKIDLSEAEKIGETVPNDIQDKYIKLETRLKGLMQGLIDSVDKTKMSSSIITFLNLLITNHSVIPFQFFVLYELCRIKTVDGELRDMGESQKEMILCVYILCKVLVKSVLVDLFYSNGTVRSSVVKK